MVPSARRYDPIVDTLVGELDDPATSMAETCRRVAERVQELGFTRPSLVQLRTLVRAEPHQREPELRRREELGEIARDVPRPRSQAGFRIRTECSTGSTARPARQRRT